MLSQEDNELLTRVGQGTPMGELLRQYWLPVLLSSELPEQDGPPKRVRLLGENLIAFRDSANRVGLLADNCSHRGASLFYGRNEEAGLRCVYHGWKYDVEGNCVDMPNEPESGSGMPDPYQPGSVGAGHALPFKDKIHHRAYPCRERNGVIWTYMGPRTALPSLPDFEWNLVPEDQRQITPFLRECNFVQAMEGDTDTVHNAYLHSSLFLDPEGPRSVSYYRARGKQPWIQVLETEYGLLHAGRYPAGEDSFAWRTYQFLLPCFTLFATRPNGVVPGHVWLPVDDTHTMIWDLRWHPAKRLADLTMNEGSRARAGAQLAGPGTYQPPTTDWLGRWRLVEGKSNDYHIDYEVQRQTSFSGIPTVPLQDQAMTESMGPIMDRSAEHLGSSDTAIIRLRERLLNAAKALRDHGETPPGVDCPSIFRVRSASVVIPNDVDWIEHTKAWRECRTEVIPAGSA